LARRRHQRRARSVAARRGRMGGVRGDRGTGPGRPPGAHPAAGGAVPHAARLAAAVALRPPPPDARRRAPNVLPLVAATRSLAPHPPRLLGHTHARAHGLLRSPGRRGGDRLPGGPARLGGAPVSGTVERRYDVVIIGSGAGGGTVAQELAPLVRNGQSILVLEKGPRFADHEFTGVELEMAEALYEEGGGFLTSDGSMTLAFASAYGGSTVVYTGTSLTAPERVIRGWGVPGLDHADLVRRSAKYAEQNSVHLLEESLINDNNRLFVVGGRAAGVAAGRASRARRAGRVRGGRDRHAGAAAPLGPRGAPAAPRPGLHVSSRPHPGGRAPARHHQRRGPPQELFRGPRGRRAVRARDVHVFPVRDGEEPHGLRRVPQRRHAGVPAAADDPAA